MTKKESVLLAFTGGPLEGVIMQVEVEWPPPQTWQLNPLEAYGCYKMLNKSELAEVPDFILRGAEYIWVEGPVQ